MNTTTRTTLAAALIATAEAFTGPAASAAPTGAYTEPLSVTPGGQAGDGASSGPVLSRDGRYAVYTLSRTGEGDVVFLRDRVKGTTERISRPDPTWEPRNALAPTVSDDWGDVWMYDRRTHAYTQIAAASTARRTPSTCGT